MRSLRVVTVLIAGVLAMAQAAEYPVMGSVEKLDPALDGLLAPDAKLEKLAEGFNWSEGPIWIKTGGGYLLFSDVPENIVFKWKEGDTKADIYLKPSGYTGSVPRGGEPGSNGLTLDAKGHLISCEHGDRRVSRLECDGTKTTLADKYNGKRFNSPNDVVVKKNGDIYFTDPPYGLIKNWDDPAREQDVCGVYRISAKDGAVTLLTGELARPNGLAFSPDEKILYVAQSDSKAPIIKAYPVKDDGTLAEGKILFDTAPLMKKGLKGLPDGLKIDTKGNLWTTGPGGVLIITPDGKHLGSILTGQATANCNWGDDGSTLYITADMFLCRIRTKAKGAGW